MSILQVIDTTKALLQDEELGLKHAVDVLAVHSSAAIRSDFAFGAWALKGQIVPATFGNVMLRPGRWTAEVKQQPQQQRDSVDYLEIGFEHFGTDPETVQANVLVVAVALAQVLDQLRDYSDANGGTVVEIAGPIDFNFGEFAGATSHGFLATVPLTERSSQ